MNGDIVAEFSRIVLSISGATAWKKSLAFNAAEKRSGRINEDVLQLLTTGHPEFDRLDRD